MSFYTVYEPYQTGRGGRGVSHVYVGSPRMRGHGLGSWFSGIFRSALPFLAKGARAVGKEALRAGVNILEDVGENNMTFKDSLKSRLNESGHNLKRKATEKLSKIMEGSGYNNLHAKRLAQSRLALGPRRTVSRRKKRRTAAASTKTKKRKTKKRTRRAKPVKRLKKKRTKKRKSKKKKRGARKSKKTPDIFG